jgi:hypothetical protein
MTKVELVGGDGLSTGENVGNEGADTARLVLGRHDDAGCWGIADAFFAPRRVPRWPAW